MRNSACEGAARTPLSLKAFDVLTHLVSNAPRLVTKEELLDAVWPDTCIGEAVLKVRVAEIRKALRDESKEPRFIETAHRRGYRFVGKIEEPASSPEPATDPIVGREDEVCRLEACWEKALCGESQMVFLSGEAGIGKTALLDTFLTRAAGRPGLHIARGQCLDQHGDAEPYFAVWVALAELSRRYGRERFASVLQQYAPTWLAGMPWLTTGSGPAQDMPPSFAMPRMIREFSALVDALSSDAPLIFVLAAARPDDSCPLAPTGPASGLSTTRRPRA